MTSAPLALKQFKFLYEKLYQSAAGDSMNTCQGCLFEFNCTLFGMRNAGQTLVRAMQIILRALKGFADAYFDDCAVTSDKWYAHLMHLQKFLSTMKAEGITLKLKNVVATQCKAVFFSSAVLILVLVFV